MAITAQEVEHVASLAKLAFAKEELPKFAAQEDEIIEMVQKLAEVDTTGVPMTFNIFDQENVMREDVAQKGTDRDLLMKNVPEEKDGLIKVPAIIDESEEA